MIRKGEPPRKHIFPLSSNTKKPTKATITETKSSNNYESIKEKVTNDGARKFIK